MDWLSSEKKTFGGLLKFEFDTCTLNCGDEVTARAAFDFDWNNIKMVSCGISSNSGPPKTEESSNFNNGSDNTLTNRNIAKIEKDNSAGTNTLPSYNGSFNSENEEAEIGSLPPSYDHTHRKLKSRHIQLIGIGGTIGTALYVQIGRGLTQGGPASLFIAFTLW